MKQSHYYHLAGFAIKARSRRIAVRKFVRLGFAAYVAENETRPLEKGQPKPLAYLEVRP